MKQNDNLQKRAKRLILGRAQQAFLRFPKGLGEVCLDEVRTHLKSPIFPQLSAPNIYLTNNAVHIEGIHFRELLALAMRITTARDLLWIVSGGRAETKAQLKTRISQVPWDFLLTPGTHWTIKSTSKGSRIFHEGLIKDLARQEIETHGCQVTAVRDADQRLDLQLVDNRLQVAVSISGRYLYQRRYKVALRSLAPLKEDLAAGMVRSAYSHSFLPPTSAESTLVWIPFAGSGTLAFESALHLYEIAPELFFGPLGAEAFPCTPQASAAYARKILRTREPKQAGSLVRWLLVEKDSEQIEALTQNVSSFQKKIQELYGHRLEISVHHADVFQDKHLDLEDADNLLVLLNPPYGQRLGAASEASNIYRKIAQRTNDTPRDKNVFGAVLIPHRTCLQKFLEPLKNFQTQETQVRHGGKHIYLITFQREKISPRE